MDFRNRAALVTGGTGALGSDVVLELIRRGAQAIVTYTSEPEWQRLRERAGEARAMLAPVKVDLTRAADVESALLNAAEHAGRLDFLVAAAGGFAPGRSYETDEATLERMLSINLRTLWNIIRHALPIMVRRNFGRIVTVSSATILGGGGAGVAAYAVSKQAVLKLSEILADETKKHDIRVRCVLPGTMDTEANRRSMPKADFSKWLKTTDVARTICDLLGEPPDACGPVAVPLPSSV